MPLIWFRIASEGSGPKRYTLQVPFQLETHVLNFEGADELAIEDLALQIVENEGIHLLRIRGFRTHDLAEAFFPKVRGALLRLILKKKMGLKTTAEMQTVTLHPSPIEARGDPLFKHNGWTHHDGVVDATPSVVIPEHLRIMEIGLGSVRVSIGIRARSLLEGLAAELALQNPEKIALDERLSLAIELYASTLVEQSKRARVVNLATSLELLIKPERISRIAMEQIDCLLTVFDSNRTQAAENAEENRDLTRIRSRIAGLKQESISEGLRSLVSTHANVIGVTPEDARRQMGQAYDVRCKLVHDGNATDEKITAAVEWLIRAVPAILESVVDRAVSEVG